MNWIYSKAFVIFLSTDDSYKSYFDYCGREFVTCGILFRLLDSDTNVHFQYFYADSLTGRFSAIPNFTSSETNKIVEDYNINWSNIQGLCITSDSNTIEIIYRLCRACHSTLKGYNQFDRVCTVVVPFYNPKDSKSIFDVDSLHSAQAVVLILKECLPKSHLLMSRLHAVNSRSVTPDALHNILTGIESPHQMCIYKLL